MRPRYGKRCAYVTGGGLSEKTAADRFGRLRAPSSVVIHVFVIHFFYLFLSHSLFVAVARRSIIPSQSNALCLRHEEKNINRHYCQPKYSREYRTSRRGLDGGYVNRFFYTPDSRVSSKCLKLLLSCAHVC